MNLDEKLQQDIDNIVSATEDMSRHIQEKIKENFIESMEQYVKTNEVTIKDIAAIDRIEEDKFAVCELLDGKMVNIPLEQFKYDVKSGDVINIEVIYKNGEINKIEVKDKNEEERQRRIQLIQERIQKLKEKNNME